MFPRFVEGRCVSPISPAGVLDFTAQQDGEGRQGGAQRRVAAARAIVDASSRSPLRTKEAINTGSAALGRRAAYAPVPGAYRARVHALQFWFPHTLPRLVGI
jgi:hypothetical protein